jgi:hypothetical protein
MVRKDVPFFAMREFQQRSTFQFYQQKTGSWFPALQ